MTHRHDPAPARSPSHLRIPPRSRIRNQPLTGEQFTLTPIDPADGPELWTLVERSREHLERWLPWVPFNSTPSASQRYVDSCAADWDAGKAVRLGIRLRPSGALAGLVGLDSCVHIHKSCELGYWLSESLTGRGLMTQAVRLCLDFAFNELGIHRVRCAAATGNNPSLQVIKRLGFHFEGVARGAECVRGVWLDHAVFGLLSTDERPW